MLDKIELRYLSRYVGILDESGRITVFDRPSAKAIRLLRGLHPSGALVKWHHTCGLPDYTTIDGVPI